MAVCKYRACKAYDKVDGHEYFWVERTHPDYGWPAVLVPEPQPRYECYQDAVAYAKHLNCDNEQLTLFDI